MALLASGALLVGCTTTHPLGRIDDPGTQAELSTLASSGENRLRLRDEPVTKGPQFGYRVSGVTPSGLLIAPPDQQTDPVVPLSRVESVSRYDHARGARDGAIGGGFAGLIVGLAFMILVTTAGRDCSDDCGPRPNAATLALRIGGLFTLIGAALGAALGAVAGHEDRFVVAPQ